MGACRRQCGSVETPQSVLPKPYRVLKRRGVSNLPGTDQYRDRHAAKPIHAREAGFVVTERGDAPTFQDQVRFRVTDWGVSTAVVQQSCRRNVAIPVHSGAMTAYFSPLHLLTARIQSQRVSKPVSFAANLWYFPSCPKDPSRFRSPRICGRRFRSDVFCWTREAGLHSRDR